jgi:hypothetical protein
MDITINLSETAVFILTSGLVLIAVSWAIYLIRGQR